jgi:hypothetical protein
METLILGLKENEDRAGAALRRIRDDHLYREAGYKSFGQYLRERWGWPRFYAYHLIRAQQLNESVAKEITRLLQRYWPSVSSVEFVHDTQRRVSVIEVRHR